MEFATLRHFTSPSNKPYACLHLPFFYSPCSSQCHHSAYTQPLRYSLAHRADTTNNVEQVSSLASWHNLHPKETKQSAYLLCPLNYVKREDTTFYLLQNPFCHSSTHNINSISHIRVCQVASLHVFSMPVAKPYASSPLLAHNSHHLWQCCTNSRRRLFFYLPTHGADKTHKIRRTVCSHLSPALYHQTRNPTLTHLVRRTPLTDSSGALPTGADSFSATHFGTVQTE